MEDISHSCSLFEESASNIDFTFAFILTELLILRLYYIISILDGFLQSSLKLFPFLGFLASKIKERNEEIQNKQEKYEETSWITGILILGIYLSISSLLLYFRIDRHSVFQNFLLHYFSPYFAQLSKIVICYGDISFIPRNSSIGYFIRIIGLLIAQYSSFFFLWIHHEVQGNWTSFIHWRKQDNKLVTSGPFRIVRHPMYFSAFLMTIGYGLALWNWILFILWSPMIVTLFSIIPIEEKSLRETYGEEYQKFCSKTKYAVIPFVY